MKISYYMPFKPLDHPNPSGDLIIGRNLYEHLAKDNEIHPASSLRCRWIFFRPRAIYHYFLEANRLKKELQSSSKPDLWLSYHSYYKAPDLLGPIAANNEIPYIIFQGIYSTKRRRKIKTAIGFWLNRRALLKADLIITNKKRDYKNLSRLRSKEDITYIPPGIQPHLFPKTEIIESDIQSHWREDDKTIVVLSVAMFRPGVKTEGLKRVISSMRDLLPDHPNLRLVIIGDGECRQELEQEASDLGDRVIFEGLVARESLYKYYNQADIFAFPGIHESLGMVYLEAQSCGLPVVAYKDWGASEAVVDKHTGLLSPAADHQQFTDNLALLVADHKLRTNLGHQAQKHIRKNHDIDKNYLMLNKVLSKVANSST